MKITRTELGANDNGRRLDRIVRKYLPEIPLSRIYRALRGREITINGKRVRGDTRVSEGDSLEIADTLEGARRAPAPAPGASSSAVGASEIAGRIVHESAELLVVNKAWGELTHGEDSLEEKVRRYLAGRGPAGISYRPGPVHRLDRNTSGLVVFGASLRGAQKATEDLKSGRIVKRYAAILEGVVAADRWEDVLERDTEQRVTRAVKDEREGDGRGEARARRAVTRGGIGRNGRELLARHRADRHGENASDSRSGGASRPSTARRPEVREFGSRTVLVARCHAERGPPRREGRFRASRRTAARAVPRSSGGAVR